MSKLYETDVIAWSEQQVMLLRAGQFSQLDTDNIVEEIADVGKSEKREIASRLSVLTMHLLKWHLQPGRRCASWRRTIRQQRKMLGRKISRAPSLKTLLNNAEWLDEIWIDAGSHAIKEAGLHDLPENCPWTLEQILPQDFWPD